MDMPIVNEDNSTVDLTGYTLATLTIKDPRLGTILLSKGCTIPVANPGKVRWLMVSGDTNMVSGNYIGQLEITGTGLDKKTYTFSVLVIDSLT